MISFKNFILFERPLSFNEIIKHNYAEILANKIEKEEEIELENGRKVIFDKKDEKIKQLIHYLKNNIGSIKDIIQINRRYIPLLKIKNSNELISFNDISKKNVFGNIVKYNKGDISEGLLAIAVTCKFINPTKEINENDMIFIISQLQKINDNEYSYIKKIKNNIDKISLKIILKEKSYMGLLDVDYRAYLKSEYNSSIKFANSKYVKEHALLVEQNNTDDTVIISSIGAEDVKGTKVDMYVLIGYNNQKPIKTNLNFSIKSGNARALHQSGVSYEKIKELFENFGIDLSLFDLEWKKELKWYEDVFKFAEASMNKKLLKDDSKIEYEIFNNLIKGIRWAATRNDSSVLKLHIQKGDFKIASYNKLEELLGDYKFEAVYDPSAKNPKFAFRVKDNNFKGNLGELIVFRLEVRDGTRITTIIVEQGKFLENILY